MRSTICSILSLLFIAGCSYSVDMVTPEKISTAYKGQVLPATMNLYLSEELKTKIWEGHPSSFAGSVHTFQVPLGSVVTTASKNTFQSLFRKLNIVDSVNAGKGAMGTIVPTIKDYSFGVSDMTLV
ncbi:MAG: hypothetical protein PVG86_12685, partial [Desulfobacterales bacterium]